MYERKNTCYTSIIRMILIGVRMEHRVRQSVLAKALDTTNSAVTKIESGFQSLPIPTFRIICNTLQIKPTDVLLAADFYESTLKNAYGWSVTNKDTRNPNEDSLLILTKKYYQTPGSHHQKESISVLDVKNYPEQDLAGVFRFACNLQFRESCLL